MAGKAKKNYGKAWTAEDDRILREMYDASIGIREIAEKLQRTATAIKSRARVLNITRRSRCSVWAPYKTERLKELYPRMKNSDIAAILGVSEGSIAGYAFKLRLVKDPEWKREQYMKTAFKKGHVPPNKGKKWDEYLSKEKQELSRRTCFKKGQVPKNHKPLGYERVTVDGYREIKVAEPDVFVGKHRLLYEQHYGPIPEGMNIVFIDGNKENITIENLRMESMAEKFNRCCSIHNTLPPELRKLVQLKGALKRQLNKFSETESKQKRKRRKKND